MVNKLSILSYSHNTFTEFVKSTLGKGSVHAGLIYEELMRSGEIRADGPAFHNAQHLVEEIKSLIAFELPEISSQKSDGTTGKFLLKTHDNLEIESVLIPMQSGGTLCVSSQAGCRMGCTFCETGRMGLLRNLTTEEIVSQIFIARHILNFSFRNIVFMGMGEPFDNYDAVMQAVKVLNDPKGFSFGRKHIAISTSGCIEGIERLMTEGEYAPNLAVSINAPTDEMRNRLMPVNRKHNMQALYDIMQRYCSQTNREILVAYVLLKGHNDQIEHAELLAMYLQGLNVKVNLIPYNPQSRDRFAQPDEETVEEFSKCLRSSGLYTLRRLTKGKEIMAACGQLGNVKLRQQLRVL